MVIQTKKWLEIYISVFLYDCVRKLIILAKEFQKPLDTVTFQIYEFILI